MAVKYVKDFAFDSGFGFSGSSGKTPVRAYMRGGAVKSNPTKAPSIAPAMVEKRSKGLGGLTPETKKLAAYDKPHVAGKKGAKVAQYAKGGAVKKAHAKKEMPSFLKAKMMKKAQGGPVAELDSGYAESPLQAMAMPDRGLERYAGGRGPEGDNTDYGYVRDNFVGILPEEPNYNDPRYIGPGQLISEGRREPIGDLLPLPPEEQTGMKQPSNDFLRQLMERDTQRMRGDAAQQMRDLDRISRTGPGAPEPIGELMPLPEEPQYDIPPELRGPPKRIPASRAMTPLPTSAPIKSVDDFAPKPIAGLGPMKPGVSVPRLPMAGELGFGTSKGLSRSPLARAGVDAARTARREMRADRRDMARDIMDRYIAGPRRAMPAPRRAMPVAPSEPMIQIPRAPRGGIATFAKGGKVSKGEKKIGKVMGEFKRGELHSGSKKGPIVTNPKQATAIALSEARAAGAKIPKKKAMGGKACG